MTETPQGLDPSAQIAPQFMVQALQERVGNLTYENTMLSAFNNQLISQLKELEQQLEEERSNKENDGSGSPPPDPDPPSGADPAQRNGSERGPSPTDLARRARTRGGQ